MLTDCKGADRLPHSWVSEFWVDRKRQKSLCNHISYLHVECRNVNAAFCSQTTVNLFIWSVLVLCSVTAVVVEHQGRGSRPLGNAPLF